MQGKEGNAGSIFAPVPVCTWVEGTVGFQAATANCGTEHMEKRRDNFWCLQMITH